ncbi:chorismate synthase [Geothrix sp. PMB-07]|uniref:chorismate synthase n=1 Tax=Geothrix sp. PMB-07 TaxID=3068640 RepID=UPI002740DE55|nr:chorismate synthase [Geothrix sp. PMB-07]WLT33244.1 chorismate synthase [Geothrix sp. PMB-07]
MLFDSPSSFGRAFRMVTFGESHGAAVGVVIDGAKPGLPFDLEAIQGEMDRRRPGQSDLVTPRSEADRVQVLSGVFEGKTTGHPIALVVFNENQKSGDYKAISDLFRPGHADLTYDRKYGIRDPRGGGRSSGRETLARVAAGAWAKQQLAALGVTVRGFNREIAGIAGRAVDWAFVERNALRVADASVFEAQKAAVEAAKAEGDSVGGVCEVWIEGLPIGLGDPAFGKLDGLLALACMSIGAVKGVELGSGFESARRRGSENNDPLGPEGPEKNDAGGTLGGISTGAPVVVRLAVKPTSSISKTQRTINREGQTADIATHGRHDPCIAPRIVPVAEAMCALVIYDAWLTQQELREGSVPSVPEWDWTALEALFPDRESQRL